MKPPYSPEEEEKAEHYSMIKVNAYVFNEFNCIVTYWDFPLYRSIISFPVIIGSSQVMIPGSGCNDF